LIVTPLSSKFATPPKSFVSRKLTDFSYGSLGRAN
jgi:hypothetical protein